MSLSQTDQLWILAFVVAPLSVLLVGFVMLYTLERSIKRAHRNDPK